MGPTGEIERTVEVVVRGVAAGPGKSRLLHARHLLKTSALSTLALALSGFTAHAQDALWQPQVRAIIGADNHGGNAALEGFVPLKQTAESVLFLDVRSKDDFHNGFGQDIGLGIRRIVNPDLPRLVAAIRGDRRYERGISLNAASKHFGGVLAVNRVSLSLQEGEIHGLIGPNGSGKTTLLNLISGYYLIDQGAIELDDATLTQSSVQRRAALGVARTFQKPRLLGTLSGLDNAMLGGWKDARSGFMQNLLALPAARRQDTQLRARALEILHAMGLSHIVDKPASLLDHAEQRFLEIARALCMQPRFILLDEPAGGLTEHEIDQLANIVLAMRDAGIGVLIIEHHTDFVFRICDRVTALNLGSSIASGSAAEVRADPEVIRVYLGA